MSELKHGFGAAKMNKDADERTVPNGEYRDALNVQIVTSDGSNVGTLQTLLGNSDSNIISSFQGTLSPYAKCVGSVADEANNKIYYFVNDHNGYTDYIFEYNVSDSTLKPLIVDKWRVVAAISQASLASAAGPATKLYISDGGNTSGNYTNVRPGMIIAGLFSGGVLVNNSDQIIVNKMKHVVNHWEVYMDDLLGDSILYDASGLESTSGYIGFTADKALDFEGEMITGINVVDNTIYWTDGSSEPKKININNVQTDASGLYHTKFLVKVDDTIITHGGAATHIDFRENPDYMKEQHLTVIKKSPLCPPTLLLSDTSNSNFTSTGATSVLSSSINEFFVDENDSSLDVGSVKNIVFLSSQKPDYKKGDLILLSRTNDFVAIDEFDNYEVMVEILDYNGSSAISSSLGDAKIKIVYILSSLDGQLFSAPETFNTMLKRENPLYEFKFPRFAYRYKYQDNQYSCYSPFSEPAFLPGKFDYKPKDGYNLGMVNTLRSLYICDFLPDSDTLPTDVVEVDILYKESNTNNVYTVKTIKHGDAEWVAKGTSMVTFNSGYARTKGALLITSEMVRAAIASNQLLRPWDNVPRTAKAQEMVGNRIVYANYKQNYNLK